jgi:acetyl-CoA carboxylase biotin carboxyl carrier protein
VFALSDIEALILAAGKSPIAELELEKAGWRIRIVRKAGTSSKLASVSSPRCAPQTPRPQAPAPQPAATRQAEKQILSPGHGMLHLSASPDEAPYVAVGQTIELGQQVGIIEAMKVFSAILAPHGGTLVEVLAQSGQDVEAGQPLFRLA